MYTHRQTLDFENIQASRGPPSQQVPPPPRVQQPGMTGRGPPGMPPGSAPPSGMSPTLSLTMYVLY